MLSALRTRPLGTVYDRILEYARYDADALRVSSELDRTKTFEEAIQKACAGSRCVIPLINALVEGVSLGDFDTSVYYQSNLRVDVEIDRDTINFRNLVEPRMGDPTGGARTKRRRKKRSKVNRKVGRRGPTEHAPRRAR